MHTYTAPKSASESQGH